MPPLLPRLVLPGLLLPGLLPPSLLLLGPIGCGPTSTGGPAAKSATDSAGDSGRAGPEGVTLEAVRWSVEQDPTGLSLLEEGGWRLTRSDGLELELYEGYLVVHTLVLEPCDELSQRTPPPHGLPDHASRTLQPVVLPLHALTGAELGEASFPAEPFCEVGIALFRGEADSPGMPESGLLDDRSFWMRGALRPDPDSPWTPLELESQLLVERDLPLVSELSGAAAVTVRLHPVHLFDEVHPDEHPERLALDIMAKLADTAEVLLTADP